MFSSDHRCLPTPYRQKIAAGTQARRMLTSVIWTPGNPLLARRAPRRSGNPASHRRHIERIALHRMRHRETEENMEADRDRILRMVRDCDADASLPWNALFNEYLSQLAAIAPAIGADALAAMVRLGAACHRKTHAELAASEATAIALGRLRIHAASRARNHGLD
ncbi:MAG: hypothetical protein ACTHKB_07265 [Burkholderiaceae bacterium]